MLKGVDELGNVYIKSLSFPASDTGLIQVQSNSRQALQEALK